MGRKPDPKKVAQGLVTAAEGGLAEANKAVEKSNDAAKTAATIASAEGAKDEHRDAASEAAIAADNAAVVVTAAEDALTEAKDALVALDAPKKAPYVVAKGVSITATGKRLLDSGSPIEANDLTGGKKSFDSLVKASKIVKNA